MKIADCGTQPGAHQSFLLRDVRGCNRLTNDALRSTTNHEIARKRRYDALEKCVCPCTCTDTDGIDDADDEAGSESEDDIEENINPITAGYEEQVTRSFGWQEIATLTDDQEVERPLFFESGMHAAVARTHDLGRPDESSLCNPENTIGQSEVRNLAYPLEPWDVEALHLATGQTYFDLIETFPETAYMELPRSPWHMTPPSILQCEQCERPRNDVVARLLAQDLCRQVSNMRAVHKSQ